MADLKSGTTVGGAGIWNASNLQLTPSGNFLSYRGYKVYTSNDKPSAEDIGALSLANGGTIARPVTMNSTLSVLNQVDVNSLISTNRIGVFRAGATSTIAMARVDLSPTTNPVAEAVVTQIYGSAPSASADPYAGAVLSSMITTWKPDGSGKLYIDTRQNGAVTSRIAIDGGAQQVAVDIGSFRVLGNTQLAALSATTGTFTGAVTAPSVTPGSYANFDSRYMTGIPKTVLPAGVTYFSDPSVTEKTDVYAATGNVVDGPRGNTNYSVILVNYRRSVSTGVSLVQICHMNGTSYIRTASGSPGAWSWNGGDVNGWRLMYDSANPPSSNDVRALPITGGTLTGGLVVNGATTSAGLITGQAGMVVTGNILTNTITTTGAIKSSGVLALNGHQITGQNNSTILIDYLNGDTGINASFTTAGAHGSLYLGPSNTNNIIAGAPFISNYTMTVNNDSIANTFTASGGIIRTRSAGGTNSHLYFENAGAGERALLYAGDDGILNIRTAAQRVNFLTQITSSGSISSGGNLTAGGTVYAGNGSSILAGDGNVYGSAWGGWLSSWATGRTQGISDIGSYMWALFNGPAVGWGVYVPGGNLFPASGDGNIDSNITLPGTWMACGRSVLINDAHRCTLWRRMS